MSLTEWKINTADKTQVKKISKKHNIPLLAAAILCARNITQDDDVRDFLHSSRKKISPCDFTDMKKATACVKDSLEKGEKICVYGDYDADGITATAIVYLYLKQKGANITYYIPDRECEGYGLSNFSVKKLCEESVKLIITVDNGVSAYNEVALANSLGMRVVITDHHKLPEKLPCAEAVVDPQRENIDEKLKNYAGVGVAFKFIEAMEGEEKHEELENEYADLVALGTLGDSIELFGESRDMVKKGVSLISNSKRKGIRAILSGCKLSGKSLSARDVTFGIVPRINAAGRMQHSYRALELLICESDEDAQIYRECTEKLNSLRKTFESEILEAVETELSKNSGKKHENVIVVCGLGWHNGVLGIVASRISQKYGKPCVLISSCGEEARGSCRSVEGFSIYDLILSCSEHLDRFGGHAAAAGINLKSENIEKFCGAILENSRKCIVPFPKLNADLQIKLSAVSGSTLRAMEFLKPFGMGNPEPVFVIAGVKLEKIFPIGGGNHLKLAFSCLGENLEVLFFKKKVEDFLYEKGDILDIAVVLSENEFRGVKSVCVAVVDIRFSGFDATEALNQKRIYEKFGRNEFICEKEAELLLASHEEFAKIYKYLKINENKKIRADTLSHRIFKDFLHCGKIYVALEVFQEMGLILVCYDADEYKIKIKDNKTKINLNDSQILSKIKLMKEG